MENYKQDFIDFLVLSESLKVGEFSLKSKRQSPYFVNTGEFNKGSLISGLGEAYAQAIIDNNIECDILFGPSYKGIPLVLATSIALLKMGKDVGYAFDRKEAKDHGEASSLLNKSKSDIQKAYLLGSKIPPNSKIVILDDVFTTGDTKYECINFLNNVSENPKISAILIAVDRMEVDIFGRDGINEFSKQTNIAIYSIVNSKEILEYLKKETIFSIKDLTKIENYLSVYGTKEAKEMDKTNEVLISKKRSIIPACDVEGIEELEKIVKETTYLEDIGAYKIGFELALTHGLAHIVETIRKHSSKPIMYDHQKAGTDIPATAKGFCRVCKKAGIDAVIYFPQAGPETLKAWVYEAKNEGLIPIIGGIMTHPAYLKEDGGFISKEDALRIYQIAGMSGVNNFVVPANKPEIIKEIKEILSQYKDIEPVFYSPGLVTQGGEIKEASDAVGRLDWHAIIGRGIYQSNNIKSSAEKYINEINNSLS